MLSISIFIILSSIITGAVIYRARGGWPSIARPLEQMAYCSIFAFLMAALDAIWWHNGIGYTLAVVAVLTGHGQYFLSLSVRAISPETLDFILLPFFGADPRSHEKYEEYREYVDWYKDDPEKRKRFHDEIEPQIQADMEAYGMRKLYMRCLAGMALTGGVVTLAPAIVIALNYFWAGTALGLFGIACKPLAYHVSHKMGWGTEGGEFGTGGS